MNFTTEQIRLLGEGERMMDDGYPFVVMGGARLMASPECMEYFGLRTGQTITMEIYIAMLKWKIAECERLMVEQEMNNLKPVENPCKAAPNKATY